MEFLGFQAVGIYLRFIEEILMTQLIVASEDCKG